MRELTEMQLESISGGNNMTWRSEYAAMSTASPSTSSSSPVASPSSNTINQYGNGNAAIVVVQNVVLINSVLSIDILQGTGFA